MIATIAPPQPLLATPGAFVASPEQLIDWAIEAEEGDRCVYARVTSLGHHGAIRAQAQRLAGQHVLQLTQQRHEAGNGLFDYIAKRTCAPWGAAPAPEPVSDDALTAEARRVLDLIVRRADAAAPLVSNRGIAKACGLRDADAAAYQLRVLSDRGFIIRTPVPVDPGRVITVVETGARTGMIGR